MTAFTYPLEVRRNDPQSTVDTRPLEVQLVRQFAINVGNTGTAVDTTAINGFIAPAGSVITNAFMDVLTGYDNVLSRIRVGTVASQESIFAEVTINTTGRRTYAATAAQISANAIPFAADTMIRAVVSIATSTVTAGNVVVTVFLA